MKDRFLIWFEKTFLLSWKPFAWIAGIGFLIYVQALFFDFVYLDDNVLILDKFDFISNLGNIFKAFIQDFFNLSYSVDAYYRPLVTVSLILDAQLGDKSPFMYHLTNVALHIANSLLLFKLLRALGYRKYQSFLSSLIFIVHPAIAQAVVWIPGRNDTLLSLFVLLSFITFIRFLRIKDWKYLMLHFVTFTCALFTKEAGIIVLPICFLYLAINKEKFEDSIEMVKKNFISIITTIGVIILVWFLFRNSALVSPMKLTPSDISSSVTESIFKIPLHYIGKFFLPFNLAVIETLEDVNIIVGVILLLLIVLLVLYTYLRSKANDCKREVFFGITWFFAFLAPTFLISQYYLLENRFYVPFIGLILILLEISKLLKIKVKNLISLLIIFGVITVLSYLTIEYSGYYKDRISFWERAVIDSPNLPLTHRNLGAMYYLEGRLDEAEAEYNKTIEIKFDEQMVHNNLGLIYLSRNEYQRAREEFLKEIEINPAYAAAYFNLGLVYYEEENWEKAKEMWMKTIEVDPNYANAHLGLKELEKLEEN